jgi:hypothetical protein
MTTSPAELHFRRYELILDGIVKTYPNPSTLFPTNGKSPSYVRQQIREALEIYLRTPSIESTIPRDVAQAVFNTFTFGSTLDHIHIGPRKKKPTQCNAVIAAAETPTLSIDCLNFSIASAICLLKDFDQFSSIPITLTSLSPDSASELEATYPNISLTPTADPGTYTLL